jgi:hypothetical protein
MVTGNHFATTMYMLWMRSATFKNRIVPYSVCNTYCFIAAPAASLQQQSISHFVIADTQDDWSSLSNFDEGP